VRVTTDELSSSQPQAWGLNRSYGVETSMTGQNSSPLQGRLGEVHLRVADAGRAARFLGALPGAEPDSTGSDTDSDQRVNTVLTDNQSAAPVRMYFETPDPEAALAHAVTLGGSGAHITDARDDQGVALGFYSAGATPRPAGCQPTGIAMGPVIVLAPDTARARVFHRELFGQAFHKVGSGDFWWVSSGPSIGIFPAAPKVASPDGPNRAGGPDIQVFFVVGDLDRSVGRVEALGGKVLDRDALGHFHVCDCRDDQGTRFGLWWDSSS